MDPDKALALFRDPNTPAEGIEAAVALDEWLSKGGFLPRDWAGPRLDDAQSILNHLNGGLALFHTHTERARTARRTGNFDLELASLQLAVEAVETLESELRGSLHPDVTHVPPMPRGLDIESTISVSVGDGDDRG